MRKRKFVPSVDGRLENRVVPSTASGHIAATAVHASGGQIDPSIPFVIAPPGVHQNAINFTSHTFYQVLQSRGAGIDGLSIIFNRFNHTGNIFRLDHDLAVLSHRIPYGAVDLLPVWQNTVNAAGLSFTVRDFNNVVQHQLIVDMLNYGAANLGVSFNVLKSHDHHNTDNILVFNGRV